MGAPSYNQGHYWRCGACGTIFLWPLPAFEDNLAFEGDENAEALAAADDRRLGLLRRRLALLGKPSPGADRLLDIGCSTGRLMGLAREAGWNVTGIEMSAALAEEAGRYCGKRVITGDVMSLDLSEFGEFDAIISLDVLEHVLDPGAFLVRCYALLKPGGRLVLHTPNAGSLRSRLQRGGWNMLIPEYHFTLFSGRAVVGLLEKSGFRRLEVRTMSGTGHETGVRAMVAPIKEAVLGGMGLGNALLVVAEK